MDTNETTRVWTKESIQHLLKVSDKAVVNAIKALNARQTEDERRDLTTRVQNGRGFNSNDAPFLSDIARKLPHYNDHMTPRQLARARNLLPKYWRQLLEIAEEKGAQVAKTARELTQAKAAGHAPVEFGRF